jgi:hypothetical protein
MEIQEIQYQGERVPVNYGNELPNSARLPATGAGSRRVDERRLEQMGSPTVTPEYTRLFSRIAPQVIHSEKENETYTQALFELDRRSKKLTCRERTGRTVAAMD